MNTLLRPSLFVCLLAMSLPVWAGESDSAFLGKWVRPDGGYILEIKAVKADGAVEAAYFNPSPIPVESAKIESVDGAPQLHVVLRGTGYPGSTYTLKSAEDGKKLVGNYFQAALKENYDVCFERTK